ncbi:hypothetical protein PoB_004479900 [Plakobranchus ocellatus]|uniref:Uncharacterized protein n=1 Tax=Plakobranchus ocellatus TaxID=259542 RepID=A0AAV4BHI2_9GAST|nr:hypothetical protein PoB_004479900 [Plakobranchus ocellatus]
MFYKVIESLQTTQNQEETDEGIQGKELSAGCMQKNVIHDDGNHTSGEAQCYRTAIPFHANRRPIYFQYLLHLFKRNETCSLLALVKLCFDFS